MVASTRNCSVRNESREKPDLGGAYTFVIVDGNVFDEM